MRVLVLDDDQARVKWLRRSLGRSLDLAHELDVESFLERARAERFELYILDYDLGGGLDGRTAATFLDSHGAPIVLWSNDELGAAAMHRVLVDRGQNVVAVAPYGSPALTSALRVLIGV